MTTRMMELGDVGAAERLSTSPNPSTLEADSEREPTGRRRASRSSGVGAVRGRLSVIEVVTCPVREAEIPDLRTGGAELDVLAELRRGVVANTRNGPQRIGILVADGTDGTVADELRMLLEAGGRIVRFVGLRSGPVLTERGPTVTVDCVLGALRPLYFDAIVVPPGTRAAESFSRSPRTMELLRSHARSGSLLGAIGTGAEVLEAASVGGLHAYVAPVELPFGSEEAADEIERRLDAALELRSS